jgi:hypothetical protein
MQPQVTIGLLPRLKQAFLHRPARTQQGDPHRYLSGEMPRTWRPEEDRSWPVLSNALARIDTSSGCL